jgi:RimJ/RimL family protein N-acetyltransferase
MEKNMLTFSSRVLRFWSECFTANRFVIQNPQLEISINPSLRTSRRLMVLGCEQGPQRATLTPELARRIALEDRSPSLGNSEFRGLLEEADLRLHEADWIFYLSEEETKRLTPDPEVRRLTSADQEDFARFQAAATEEDLDAAYVELEHWAVFGLVQEGELVCVASMYLWDDAPIADLGVLTRADCRGRGYAARVVRTICAYAHDQGYEPQYRCQLDHEASVRLALAAGFSRFGTWEVISPDSPDLNYGNCNMSLS